MHVDYTGVAQLECEYVEHFFLLYRLLLRGSRLVF